jgi:serine/threonine protein phosphatase PrpC
MALEIDVGFVCEKGSKEVNEDFCSAMLPPPGQEEMGSVVAIADGVSTGGMGKEAAQTTVNALVNDYYGTPSTWDASVSMDRVLSAQNAWLCGLNQRRQPAMGLTTLTALVLRGHSYTLAHVGDTRAYLLRDGQLQKLTHDHVMDHPDMSSRLLRCIGLEERVIIDYSQGDLQVGDWIVLLTDGVFKSLSDDRLTALLVEHSAEDSPQSICDRLVKAALDKGSNDNLTAMVVRVLGLDTTHLADQRRLANELPIPSKLRIGAMLDQLSVRAMVADNGINLVYQVRHPETQQLFALKTLHPARAHDPEERSMLAHEAWLSAKLGDSKAAPFLVSVREPFEGPSAFYVLYDWHGGESLQRMLDLKQAIDIPRSLKLIVDALKGVAELHRNGVLHRDIKPSNIHLGDDGQLRLLDLGVALSGREPESARLLHAGTPSFVNPEQWGFQLRAGGVDTDAPPEPADAASDLFAIGVTLYQLLSRGKLPYGEVLPYQAGRYFRDPSPPSRHNPEVPIWLDHIVLKAISRNKRERFETAEEFLLALERGASRPLTAPPPTPLIQRDPTVLWKLLLGLSVLFNLLLIYWVLFLPV